MSKEHISTLPAYNTAVISIIIVTYNAVEHLQNCLNSIYQQQYPAIEIIVIDGNSTDGTVNILQENTSQIKYWLSEPDNGVYDAMNKAIQHITGEWVYFLGADDELLPEFSTMVTELTDNTAIYYANVFAEGRKRAGYLNEYRFAKFGAYHQAMIYPKAVFIKYKYDTQYRISADFALTLKLYADKDFHFIYKDYTLANFNHTGISGTQIDVPFQKAKGGMIFKYFGLTIWLRYKIYKFKHRDDPRA
ncbi:Glycosyltransferase involved in cell wall bisynthesis [Mucilaginibacter mallensis]|uniref:Glycosyltransferase involved in cell wall bisynthesis n=1 Tax=Mucilaginibacter mallensis TaxID=652787 RepID=A0A1H1N7B0_MUCMA|nr:glycosyltransferase family 2 protein [Mucilaginibacter mallensis]SDR95001.1 Glycosyltransferase involved in cell wall bisynthesis [Mucilaginibacter mallensis]